MNKQEMRILLRRFACFGIRCLYVLQISSLIVPTAHIIDLILTLYSPNFFCGYKKIYVTWN